MWSSSRYNKIRIISARPANKQERQLYYDLSKDEKTTAELLAISDDEIDYSDIPPLPDAFWQKADMVTPDMRAKKQLMLRLDTDVYEWFKTQGEGYQILMNNVLRSYVEAQRAKQEEV